MAKTQQQLDEEERQRQLQQQQAAAGASNFSLSDLFSWIPSIGTIFTGLIVMTGLYFIAKQPGVQDWIGKTFGEDWKKTTQDAVGNADALLGNIAAGLGFGDFVNDLAANKPVDEIQKTMRNQGLPDAAIAALAGDADTWKGTVAIIKRGKGVITDPISDKNIFAFLTDPEGIKRLQPLVSGVKLTGPMDEKQKAFAAKLSGAFAPILADDRLDQLLTTYRASTLPLLLQLSPVKFDLAKLNPVIDKLALGPDGKVTPQFRELLTSLTTLSGDPAADQTAQLAALKKFIATPGVNGALIKQFVQSIDVTQLPNGDMKNYLVMAQNATPTSLEAARQLLTGPVSPARLQELAQLGADPKNGPLKLLDRLMNDEGLRNDIIQGHALYPIGVLLHEKQRTSTDPKEQAALSFLTTRPAGQPNNFVNLGALFTLVDAVSSNPHNKAVDGRTNKGTNIVIRGLVGALTATSDADRKAALATLSPQAMSFFFSDPANSAALGDFFTHLNNGALPLQQRRIVNAVRAHWGEVVTDGQGHLDAAKSHGIAEVLADPVAAKALLDAMKNPPSDTKYSGTAAGWYLWAQGGVLKQDRADIVAVATAAGALTPSPTPEANAKAVLHSRGGLGTYN